MQKEYIVSKSNQIALNITAGKVDSYREKEETSSTVRVYDQGKIGIAGALGEINFKELEKTAVKKLDDGIAYPCKLNANVQKSVIKDKPVIAYDKIIPTGKRLAKKLSVACPRFLINGKIRVGKVSGAYKNSENTQLEYENNYANVSFQLKDKDSSNIMDAFYGTGLRIYGSVTENKIVSDVKMLHDAFFGKKVTLKNGSYPMIFAPIDLLSHILKDFVAEQYVANGSLFSGKLGEKIFNENLSISDDRNPSTSLSAFYDAEGEIAPDYRMPLIKNGVFKRVLTTKKTAEMFNLPLSKTTSSSYDGVPSLGVGGIYCSRTAPDLKTLLGKKKAVFVSYSSGGDITTDGVLGLPVQLAFLVENGKITARVTDFSASGNIKDLLGDRFIGVSAKGVFDAPFDEVMVVEMDLINN